MGLDAVELVMEVEDRFGITIQDAEAEQIVTVGQLAALIESRIVATSQRTCPTLTGFLQVRRHVREFVENPDLRLRPSLEIASVIPSDRRKEFWHKLSGIFGSTMPSLQRPQFLRQAIFVIVLLSFALAFSIILFEPSLLLASMPLAFAIAWGLDRATRSYCFVPPPRLTNFGQLSRYVVGLRMATTLSQSPSEI